MRNRKLPYWIAVFQNFRAPLGCSVSLGACNWPCSYPLCHLWEKTLAGRCLQQCYLLHRAHCRMTGLSEEGTEDSRLTGNWSSERTPLSIMWWWLHPSPGIKSAYLPCLACARFRVVFRLIHPFQSVCSGSGDIGGNLFACDTSWLRSLCRREKEKIDSNTFCFVLGFLPYLPLIQSMVFSKRQWQCRLWCWSTASAIVFPPLFFTCSVTAMKSWLRHENGAYPNVRHLINIYAGEIFPGFS